MKRGDAAPRRAAASSRSARPPAGRAPRARWPIPAPRCACRVTSPRSSSARTPRSPASPRIAGTGIGICCSSSVTLTNGSSRVRERFRIQRDDQQRRPAVDDTEVAARRRVAGERHHQDVLRQVAGALQVHPHALGQVVVGSRSRRRHRASPRRPGGGGARIRAVSPACRRESSTPAAMGRVPVASVRLATAPSRPARARRRSPHTRSGARRPRRDIIPEHRPIDPGRGSMMVQPRPTGGTAGDSRSASRREVVEVVVGRADVEEARVADGPVNRAGPLRQQRRIEPRNRLSRNVVRPGRRRRWLSTTCTPTKWSGAGAGLGRARETDDPAPVVDLDPAVAGGCRVRHERHRDQGLGPFVRVEQERRGRGRSACPRSR